MPWPSPAWSWSRNTQAGLVLLSAILPAFVGSLFAGAVVDRWGSVQVLTGSYLGRALAALAFWAGTRYLATGSALPVIYAVNIIGALFSQFAIAAELLGNLGTPDAMKGLWDIISGSDATIKKLTVGALYRSNNKAVCDLVRPLLTSAFRELRTYAALLLARNGDRDAIGVLLDIQKNSSTHKTDMLTLANWYLLKFAGETERAVRELAKSVK